VTAPDAPLPAPTQQDEHCDCDGSGWLACPDCFGQGWTVTCIDDMCRGAGECMHGDGETTCRYCGGEGSVRCSCIEVRALSPDAADHGEPR
jgi:hypothetical protein